MPAVHSKEARPAAKRQKTSGVRLHEGHEHAWYRTVSDDGSSSPARADTPGRKKDTRVHRLLRNGAFRRDASNERMTSENPVLAACLNRLSDKTVRDQIDNSHRATAMLEQYTLKHVATGKFRDMLVAIEKLFDVKVEKVATQNRRGKPRRTRGGYTHTGDWKKAIVKLNEEHRIDFF